MPDGLIHSDEEANVIVRPEQHVVLVTKGGRELHTRFADILDDQFSELDLTILSFNPSEESSQFVMVEDDDDE